ncbi:uncharacterized protein Z520_06341 [Fonsecaea multimorphosa CBS 102226]|uniref:Wbp11/ELF5/Saf1 N-terminal domain-containing protein n=1 Tax=Fonsecaea multimorphosa CBS 102226 TaxID=1442371 RepID=A0A0D2IMJ9_9EURO|nr:uncharacterized protein Z520_06341 [Fonsecaea multimorphosa CBS 102226]KIX98261.1 hypothetical protein Z520_06341 [Fonsecaea multimorphosa CBS 102226]OAL22606.1 hypothetical protein AYO22_07164 [Fonsecaea multimorphosa]
MARDKERSVNPAQQQRKLEKAKQLKKSRAELQARRNEKLARRNPERLQRQIDDLKALEAAGDIKPRERAILEDLERDLRAVRKAREALGDKAPNFAGQPRRREGEGSGTTLGKRRHDGERKYQHSRQESSGSDTDESVRRIPMPEDTPPPIPREFRRHFPRREDGDNSQQATATAPRRPSLPTKPGTKPIEVKTTYESAPQIRDLRKEAVNRFVPDVVRKKQEAAKGGPTGRLIEPEEMDRLEAEGYLGNQANGGRTTDTARTAGGDDMDVDDENARRLAEEEERFLREVEMQQIQEDPDEERRPRKTVESRPVPRRNVEIEEIEDEDA